MKASLIRIGNARGICIPKPLLEQCRLQDEVEMEVRDGHLEVRPVTKPRSGWDDTFRRMHEQGDDVLLDEGLLPASQWDKAEWEW